MSEKAPTHPNTDPLSLPDVPVEMTLGAPTALIPVVPHQPAALPESGQRASTIPSPDNGLPAAQAVPERGTGGEVARRAPRVREVLRSVGDMSLRAVTAVQSELIARRSRFMKLGVIAVGAAMAGVFLTTKDANAAQIVAEHAIKHGHDMATQGSTSHAAGTHTVAYSQKLPGVHSNAHSAKHAAGIARPVEVTSADDGNEADTASTISNVAAWGIPFVAPAAIAGTAAVLWRGHRVKKRAEKEPEEHTEHKVEHVMPEAQRAIVNDPVDGDAYIEKARNPSLSPAELLSSYMDFMSHHIHGIHEMGKHLRGMDIHIHDSEIKRARGHFWYFPQGNDGYDASSMGSYMEAVQGLYPTGDAMYRHLKNVGLAVERHQIQQTGANFSYTHVDRHGRPIHPHKSSMKADAFGVLPAEDGKPASDRAKDAKSVLRGKTQHIPLSEDFLMRPDTMLAMHNLRSQAPGAPPMGLLVDRREIIAERSRATANPVLQAHLTTVLETIDRAIREQVRTILTPIAGNVQAVQALGIHGLKKIRGGLADFTTLEDRPITADMAAQFAEHLRGLDERL